MINSTKKIFSTNFIISKTKAIVLITFLVFNSIIANSQNIISVSFKDGAIGTTGNNPQDLRSLTNFTTLLIDKAYFIQNSSVTEFQLQGNDITGTLRLVTNSSKFVDVPGRMVWSSNGGTKEYMGFLPSTNLVAFNLSTFGGASYVIDNTKNIAVVFNYASVSFTNGTNVGGNASSPLSDLNVYLSTFNSSRPAGPVTVNAQTTSSTTPTITGTATLVSGESLSIEFNGVVYTNGITINGTNWSWTVPNSVLAGTYNVVATITNTAGYTLSDTSTDELVITDLNLSSLGCVTIVASGGDAEGSTWTYSNNTIMPNSAAAVNVNASVVLAKMALGNLTVAGSCIFVNAAVNDGSGSKALTLKASGNIVVSANIITGGKDLTVWSDSDNNGAGGIRVDDNVTLDTRTQLDRSGNVNTTGGGKITLAGGLDDAGVSSGVNNLIFGQAANDGYPDGYAVNSGSAATQTGIVLGTSSSATGHNSSINILSGGGDIRLSGLATNNSSNNVNGPTGLQFFHGYNIDAGNTGNIILIGNSNLTSGASSIGMDLAAWRSATSYTANGLVKTHDGNITVVGRASGGTSENLSIAIDGDGNNRNIFATTGTGSVTFNGKAVGASPVDLRLTNLDILAASGDIKIVAEGASGTSIGGYNIGNGLFLGQKAGSLVTASSSDVLIKSNILSNTNKPIAFNTSGTVTIEPYADSFSSAFSLSNVTLENIITGLTLGKPTNTSDITFGTATTISGPITAYGGNINVNENLNTTTGNANGDVLLKAKGNIIQNSSKSVTTNDGDVIFWSDSDASGTATTSGGIIALLDASSITTSGGDIVLAGGADTNADGIPDGYSVGAYATSAHSATNSTAGLFLDNASLNAGAGNVILRGQGTGNLQNYQIGTRLYGGSILGSNITIDAKGSIQGPSSSNWGLSLEGFSIEGSGNIELTGIGGRAGSFNSDANQVGVEIRRALDNSSKNSQVKATGTGTITINGVGGSGTNADPAVTVPQATGIRIEASQTNPILSADGDIILEGTSGRSGRGLGLMLGSPISSTNGNITLIGNPSIEGTLNLNGNIEINGAITTGATVSIESPGAVSQTAAITADKLSLNGTGIFTLNNTSNNIATLAGGNATTKLGSVIFTDASGGLTIGTVGSESGLTATGAIAVETLADDITLSEDVITNNTSANAIVINAGKTAAIGTATGGNIIVSGSPTVSAGTGGIIKLFSGSDAGSTGLTSFVGGSNNTRSNVDETTSSFSPGLTSNGKYALYRQAAVIVAPVISSFTPTTAGNGQTVVITGTGFTGVSIVKMGNVNASSFVVNSDTQITAVVGAARSGDVYVENSAGNDSKAGFVFKIVEYTFENNLLDETDANLDGNTSGNLTYGPGVEGKAICFTAGNNNDFVVLPNDLIRNLSDFTISLRFKTTSKGVMMGYQNTVVDGSANEYIPILVVQSDGTLRGTLWTTASQDMSVVSSEVVNDGNWHRVDMSITSTSINIYLDGVLVGSNNSGTVAHLQMSFNQLGRGRTDLSRDSGGGDLTGWEGFTGCIDNFVILDKGQSLAQINQSTALPQPTITSFAPITAKSGETVVITGTNLSGTTSLKIGGVNARSFKIISATEVHAIVGKDATVNTDIEITTAAGTATGSNFTFDCNSNALDFDGSNDYVVIGDQIENLGAFTQEAWVFWKGSSLDYSEIFTKENISAFAITNNNKLHANFGDGSRWGAGINSSTSIPLNTWTHVAVTRSSTGLVKLYINGVLDANTTTLSLTGNSPNSRVIGAKFVGNTLYGPFKGAIDELKVWNTERSIQQISAGMGSELVGNEVGLIAYYNFNQGSASGSNTTISSLNNLTGNTNLDGTIGNMALTGVGSNFVKGVWPVIISQPAASATVCPGGSISVSAVGEQLSYQWFSNNSASNAGGTPITGQTTATLTIPSSASGTQYYYVEITGACSQIQTSNVSTVTISPEPVIAYDANYSLERTLAIANIIPTSTGATVSSYSISPALPAGLSLDSNTGVISGTPSAISAPVTYTVTGSSASSCTSTTTFSLEVFNAVAPSSLSYSPSTQTVKLGTSITVMTPTSTGGAVATFTISPSLPSGLTINPTTGIISGTSTQALTGSVTYTITATNSGGTSTAEITLIFNSAPTDIALSPASIDENKSSGSAVGTLSSTDPDTGDTHTYTLVSGTGSTDNALFTIDGTQLKTTVSFDFETKSSYSVRIRTTDAGGLSYDKAITITVLDVNDAPTNLALSETSTNENNAIGFVIGQLSSTDQDAGDTHTYTLVSGTGSTDNALFTIDGNNLKTTIAFDFETKSSYSVRVRTTDAGGLSYEKIITISILDVNDAPTNISSTQTSIYEKNAVGAVIGDLSTTDQDAGDKHSYTLVSGDVAAFKISGNQLLANVVYNFGTKNSYEVVIKSTDAGGLSVNKSIKITILQQPNLFGTANLPQNKQSSAVANNVTISKGYSANLNLSATNIVKYAWSPSTGLSATNISNPIANPTQTTTYTVTVTNAQGVSTIVYITVTVLEDYNITPNNVISPDGDGVNDFWTIENLNTYPNNEVKIFDKAGRIIFNVRNYQNNWNGQLNGQILHEGAYYYIINLGPGTRPKVGYITLFSNK